MGGISKEDFIASLNQDSIIDEEEIYNAIMNRETIVDYTDHPIRIIYNKGKDNDQMLLTRIRQACAKKGYPISNANKWLGKLKKDKVIEI